MKHNPLMLGSSCQETKNLHSFTCSLNAVYTQETNFRYLIASVAVSYIYIYIYIYNMSIHKITYIGIELMTGTNWSNIHHRYRGTYWDFFLHYINVSATPYSHIVIQICINCVQKMIVWLKILLMAYNGFTNVKLMTSLNHSSLCACVRVCVWPTFFFHCMC